MRSARFMAVAAILVSLSILSACQEPPEEAVTDSTSEGQTPGGPAPGTAIAFASVAPTTMTVSWGAATDVETSQASLEYKLVSSTTNNIGSVSTAEADGTLVMDWTANTLSSPVSGLSSESTYYFTVLIKDGDGIKSYQTSSSATLCSGKMIYLADVPNAAFGGKSGADTLCNAQKPSGFSGTAKALIYDSAGGRRACSGADCSNSSAGQLDWPLAASQNYCNTNYVSTMGSTNGSGYLTVTLASSLSSSSTYTFTGMNSLYGGSDNCTDWTVWANPATAPYGRANMTGINFHSYGSAFCATDGSIYCVEQ